MQGSTSSVQDEAVMVLEEGEETDSDVVEVLDLEDEILDEENLDEERAGSELSASTSSSEETEWIEIGIVGPQHGIQGEVKIQALTDFPEERLEDPGRR